MDPHSGQCLCGAVRFTTTGPLRPVIYCHCNQCRKQTGHFLAATNVALAHLTIKGGDTIRWFAASTFARRGFCGICGSVLFWQPNDGDCISVAAGAFDLPSGLVAKEHVFVADRGDYYRITDGLPQFARSSPGLAVAPD
jgi:hypothetical protein